MQRITTKRSEEGEFIRLVEEGEVEQVKSTLQDGRIDVNCVCIRKRKPVTALQIAANNNNFQMVKLLHENGAQPLTHPRTPNGGEEDVSDDDLRYNIYNAISSPAYLSILHNDPPDAAIDLSESLLELSEAREIADTSKKIYLDIASRIRAFLAEILDCCDNSEEVLTLLNGRGQGEEVESHDHQKFSLLRKAIDFDEKEFVAHRKCQKVVKKEWLRGQPNWHTRNGFHWTTLYAIYGFLIYVLALPILCLIYIIAPCSPVEKMLLLLVAMRTEIYRFMVIYIYVVGTFTFGFYYLYYELVDSGYFSSIGSIVQSLLTVVYGSDPSSSLSAEITVNTTSGEVHDVSVVVEVIGVTLYIFFGTVIIIVLLNTSIALMSDTYSKLKENIDVEWKFVRTKIWLEYMDSPVVPPPFNIIIPSVSCIRYIHRRIRSKQTAKVGQQKQKSNMNLTRFEDDGPFIDRSLEYDKVCLYM
ncbi:uncharacterized protein LOC144434766 [Glandiceps talaboti]